jgi:hypothetical protein
LAYYSSKLVLFAAVFGQLQAISTLVLVSDFLSASIISKIMHIDADFFQVAIPTGVLLQ